MRYTTIIDITDQASIYRNQNARLVYLHMVLRSGYHDNDRDLLDMSIRRLAAETGLSVSAVRHALELLTRAQLITRQGTMWFIRKWVVNEAISNRPQNKRQAARTATAVDYAAMEEQRRQEEAVERARRAQIEATGKTSFMLWYESQQRLAAAGDTDAQEKVKKHRSTYEEHARAQKKQ